MIWNDGKKGSFIDDICCFKEEKFKFNSQVMKFMHEMSFKCFIVLVKTQRKRKQTGN